MKKLLLIFLCCWFLLPTISTAQERTPKGVQPASKLIPMDNPKRKTKAKDAEQLKPSFEVAEEATAIYGNVLRQQLNETKIIRAYKVEPFVSEETNEELLEGFKVLEIAEILSILFLLI